MASKKEIKKPFAIKILLVLRHDNRDYDKDQIISWNDQTFDTLQLATIKFFKVLGFTGEDLKNRLFEFFSENQQKIESIDQEKEDLQQ